MNVEILTATKPKEISIRNYLHMEGLKMHIQTDEDVFRRLETEWPRLAQRSKQTICMSLGWALKWWEHFGKHRNRSLFIVTIYDNLKLVAIFPFYKGVTKIGGITLQKRLQLIGSGGSRNEAFGFLDDYGISDFLDVIVDPEYGENVAELFAKLLLSPEFTDLFITFHQSRDDSYVVEYLYPQLIKSQRGVKAKRTDTCYYIELEQPGGLQAFIKKSKSNARRRFRQTLRACGTEDNYLIVEPVSLLEVELMIDKLIQLHQERWTKIGYPGAFEDQRFKTFFKEISLNAYQENRLWLKQAVDENGVCAVRMLLSYNHRFYDFMSGYNDDSPSAKYRPGIGLLLNLVKNSYNLPIERIELLRGNESYKKDFTNQFLFNWKITIPEINSYKNGWGLPAKSVQFCSILFKYFNREKLLLKVQYQRVGYSRLVLEYIKFRKGMIIRKIREMR